MIYSQILDNIQVYNQYSSHMIKQLFDKMGLQIKIAPIQILEDTK